MSMQQDTFGSKLGAIAAIAGSAVGLGNIWKFPYVCAENGGAAFLIIYILLTMTISIPVLLAELSLGRMGQQDVYHSILRLAPNKRWIILAISSLMAAYLILSFYCVISGWTMEYLWQALSGQFQGVTEQYMTERFVSFVNSGHRPIFWTLIFLALNSIILGFGVSKGIERCNKLLIPLLFIMLILLAISATRQAGWREGVEFLLRPDWSKVTGRTILAALGQSFFSLSIGAGAMLTYGSYVDKKENLMSIAIIVSISSIVIALLAGLVIFPTVFTYDVALSSGPSLVFITLPPLFGMMNGGLVVGTLFFALLFLAAITSSTSMLESLVSFVIHTHHITRARAILILYSAVGVLGSILALSQMDSSCLILLGKNLFDWADTVASNHLMPLAGLATAVLAGHYIEKNKVIDALSSKERYPGVDVIYLLLRWVCPPAIAAMYLTAFIH